MVKMWIAFDAIRKTAVCVELYIFSIHFCGDF